jgi:hypothetical protein
MADTSFDPAELEASFARECAEFEAEITEIEAKWARENAEKDSKVPASPEEHNINQKWEAALQYSAEGIGLIPAWNNKNPALKTGSVKKYWSDFATRKDLSEWFFDRGYQIGICCGSISLGGLWVLDADNQDMVRFVEENIAAGKIPPSTRVVLTRKGKHYYYKSPPKTIIQTKHYQTEFSEIGRFDFIGQGNYVIAPPSKILHKIKDGKGKTIEVIHWDYIWEQSGPWSGLCEYSPHLFLALVQAAAGRYTDSSPKAGTAQNKERLPSTVDFFAPASEGERNVRLTQDVGKLLSKGFTYGELFRLACGTNSTYDPPLPEEEVKTIVASIWQAERRNHPERYGETEPGTGREDEAYRNPLLQPGNLPFRAASFEGISARSIYNLPKPVFVWAIPQILRLKQLMLLAAPPGAGKGYFLKQLFLALASGTAPFNWEAWKADRPLNCLYFSNEDDEDETNLRVKKIADEFFFPSGIPIPDNFFIYPYNPAQMTATDDLETFLFNFVDKNLTPTDLLLDLCNLADRQKIDVIGLDTWCSFNGLDDENDNSLAGKAMTILIKYLTANQRAVILTHHTRKTDKSITDLTKLEDQLSQTLIRGASAIPGAVRVACVMLPVSPLIISTLNSQDNSIQIPTDCNLIFNVAKNNCGPTDIWYYFKRENGILTLIKSQNFIYSDINILTKHSKGKIKRSFEQIIEDLVANIDINDSKWESRVFECNSKYHFLKEIGHINSDYDRENICLTLEDEYNTYRYTVKNRKGEFLTRNKKRFDQKHYYKTAPQDAAEDLPEADQERPAGKPKEEPEEGLSEALG